MPVVLFGLLNMIFLYDEEEVDREAWKAKLKRIDFAGAILIIVAVASLLLGLDAGSQQSWSSPVAISYLCVSIAAFAAFGFVEDRVAAEPFIPKRILSTRSSVACFICNFLIYGWWLSILFQLPLSWEVGEAVTGSETGRRLLPGIFAGVVSSMIAGVVSHTCNIIQSVSQITDMNRQCKSPADFIG